jgi:soluble lytic murein transglycosylase-like protein
MIEDVYRVMDRINEIKGRFGLNKTASEETDTMQSQTKKKTSFTDELDSASSGMTPTSGQRLDRAMTVDEINSLADKVASREGVSPSLVKGIIKAESDYDVDAVSSKGALGLMQLMPETAESLGVADPFSPEQNITGGVKYLKGLIQSYHGDYKKAVAAYNAGKAAVDKNGGDAPYAETRDYVKKVLDSVSGDEKE